MKMESTAIDSSASDSASGPLADSAQPPAGPPPAPQPRTAGILLWIRDLAVAAVASVLIIIFLYQPVRVEGTSMLPRLEDRDRLFINKFVYHFTAIDRGDVVVFHYPRDPEKSYIKRVIALPGDRLRIDRGRVYRERQARARALCAAGVSRRPIYGRDDRSAGRAIS